MLDFAMLPRLVLTLFLSASLPAQADDQTEKIFEKRNDRAKQEASSLFKTILQDFEIQPQHCTFLDTWSVRPIDSSLAQKYLGSKLHADVLAPHNATNPAEIMGSADITQRHFCSEEEASRQWQHQQSEFRKGSQSGDLVEGRRHALVRMRRIEVGMPVFNQTFSTAVLTIAFNTETLFKTDLEGAKARPKAFDEAGYALRPFPEAFGYSLVYRKKAGIWKKIHSSQDFTMN